MLTRSYHPFHLTSEDLESSSQLQAQPVDMSKQAAIQEAALAFKDVFGAVDGADLRRMEHVLADDYMCQVSLPPPLESVKGRCKCSCLMHDGS